MEVKYTFTVTSEYCPGSEISFATMKINYTVMDPTGNITILVHTPVRQEEMPHIASYLMRREPETEQVGFLFYPKDDSGVIARSDRDVVPGNNARKKESGERCDICLRMAGGEFCGNAALSAAAIYAMRCGIRKCSVRLRVSGASEIIRAEIREKSAGTWNGCVEMPCPVSVDSIILPDKGLLPVVRFDGITHVILEQEFSRQEAEELAPRWCRYLDVEALGLMFLDRVNFRLTPLVFVPDAKTLCWEHSCASGTAAAGVFLAAETGAPFAGKFIQPGGTLAIEVSQDGCLRLAGTVRLIKHVFE